jgi:nucleotide-binding universal stress UspA family protein
LTDGVDRLERILAGADGSERSEEAIRQAARLAGVTGASLEVAYVMDAGRAHGDDVEQEAEEVLARAAATAAEHEVRADTRILAGDPGRTLVHEAAEEEADLVCLGPDAGLIGGALRVGQVAAHVLREARCSVLIARRDGPDFPRRLTCAVDGSEGSARTAALAAGLAAAAGSELRVVHAIPVFRGHDQEWILRDDEPSPAELEPAVLAASARGVQPVREMVMGRPEHALVRAAERSQTDLLVVGHRGVSGVRRVLLGSVSEYSAYHAPCSVLVARLGAAER